MVMILLLPVCQSSENQLKDDLPLLRLDKPLQIKYVPQIALGFRDYIALIRWTNYTNDHVVIYS